MIQPGATFSDNLKQMPPIDGIAHILLVDGAGQTIASIENKPGSQGSLALYAYLAKVFGDMLDARAADHGLALFAEHRDDACDRPGAHPNVDRLLGIVAGDAPLRIEVVGAVA